MKCSQCDKDGIVQFGTESHPDWQCEECARKTISRRKDDLWAHYLQETGYLDWTLNQAIEAQKEQQWQAFSERAETISKEARYVK